MAHKWANVESRLYKNGIRRRRCTQKKTFVGLTILIDAYKSTKCKIYNYVLKSSFINLRHLKAVIFLEVLCFEDAGARIMSQK